MLYVNLSQLEKVDRQFLVERHLISREHAEGQGARAVAIDSHEKFSLMVNEEDHLRIQVMQSGLDLASVWEQVNRIDDVIDEKVTYAFHERLGYLTACPTNVGTGMRVSVMLHLPALVITRQIDKVFRSLQKISLAVRGLYGEGSQAMGDFYQISNQVTLGRTESELIRQVSDIVPVIIDYERQARDFLIKESHENLHDRVSRAYGILRTAQTISSEETMHLLSSVRMGVNLGLIRDLNIPAINELFIRTQPAHLQKLTGGELDTTDRNIERARYLRRHLNKEDGNRRGGGAQLRLGPLSLRQRCQDNGRVPAECVLALAGLRIIRIVPAQSVHGPNLRILARCAIGRAGRAPRSAARTSPTPRRRPPRRSA